MKKNSILDTNVLLYLYNYELYANSWKQEDEDRIQKEIEGSNEILLYPVVINEYLIVLFNKYLKKTGIGTFKKAKTKGLLSNYNNGIEYLKELVKDVKFKFVETKEYECLDSFKIKENIDVVDSWLLTRSDNIITNDKSLLSELRNKSKYI